MESNSMDRFVKIDIKLSNRGGCNTKKDDECTLVAKKKGNTRAYYLSLNKAVSDIIKQKGLTSYDLYKDRFTTDLMLVFSKKGSVQLPQAELKNNHSLRLVCRAAIAIITDHFHIKESDEIVVNLGISGDLAPDPNIATFKLSYNG